jgi:hypothetical protein
MSANATEVQEYRNLYYKDEVDDRDNPLMWLDLSSSMGSIEYMRGYPYIEWSQRILTGKVSQLNTEYMTLLEAQKKAIIEDEYLGFNFSILLTEDFHEDVSGSVIFYKEDYSQSVGTVVTGGATPSSTHKSTLYMKMRKDIMPESIEYYRETYNYQGELDYVSMKIPDKALDNIRTMSKNLLDNLDSVTEENKPSYAGPGSRISIEYPLDVTNQRISAGRHGVELIFYVWETINNPWFINNGLQYSLLPDIEHIGTEDGTLNCWQSHTDFTSGIHGLGAGDNRTGYRLYTHNNTSDFAADSSSNYVRIFRITPDASAWANNDGMPRSSRINIVTPKYSRFYFLWTYRIVDGPEIVFKDFPQEYIAERKVSLSGVPPLFSPGAFIGQVGIPGINEWKWKHVDFFQWGKTITDFRTCQVERFFKPSLPPRIQYINQKLKVTIPEKDIKDLSRNFLERYQPDGRPPPTYKTYNGDIYIHPWEDNEIVRCWYNIQVFENTKNHIVKNTNTYNNYVLEDIQGFNDVTGQTIRGGISIYQEYYGPNGLYSLVDFSEKTLYRGNIYDFAISLDPYDVGFSLIKGGQWTDPNEPDYKRNIFISGTPGGGDYSVRIIVDDDTPRFIYWYNTKLRDGVLGEGKLTIRSPYEESRDYDNSIENEVYPYTDLWDDISYNSDVFTNSVDISDNDIYVQFKPDCNFDYNKVAIDDRGDTAYKDASGQNASLLLENKPLADTKIFENEWFAYEEYTPDNTQILRSYLSDYKTLPRWVHMLNVPVGAGWNVIWKYWSLLPESNDTIIDISDNEYYIRWSYSYTRYRFSREAKGIDPTTVYYDDISFNTGISPYVYFDFTEYGKIYPPPQPKWTFSRIEYPDAPKTYYKNLRLSIRTEDLLDLSKNIVYNTDLGCKISVQYYIINPKRLTDRDQRDPLIDLSHVELSVNNSLYDLSFNLVPTAYKFPDVMTIDISDTKILETTLLPGRYIAAWSYTVNHSYINPRARNYPLIPGVDYDVSASYIDISYNEFLWDNIEPVFFIPNDLSRMTLQIQPSDISGIIKHWNTYYQTLSQDTEIIFNFILWSPNYEYTQLLSGINRWELPNFFQGKEDPRIRQTPVEYTDYTTPLNLQKCWLGNDNSDSVGHVYNWGFGGEPGIQYRKVTYHDISNNEIYQKKLIFDISQVKLFKDVVDLSAVPVSKEGYRNFIIDMYIPASQDLSRNTANWGFSNYNVGAVGNTLGLFHIGVNGNGIDTSTIDDGSPMGWNNEGFIYRAPYDPALGQTYFRHRLNDLSDNKIRYHFQQAFIYGQPPSKDVTISVNDEIIYDLPGRGIDIYDISWCGQIYDISLSPVTMRPSRIEMWFQEDASSCAIYKIKDLSNDTIVRNTFTPQDFDENDTETAFYQSQRYVTEGLYIPYIARWEYQIYDPSSQFIINSRIVKSEYPDAIHRRGDWNIIQTLDGGQEFQITPEFPFEHKYYYASLYTIPKDFIRPVPMYPTIHIDLSYNPVGRELIVVFDKDKIMAPLMHNLMVYWLQYKSLTEVKLLLYGWFPNSEKLPVNYNDPTDIELYNLWDPVYDISFTIQSSSPYNISNILPLIPHNVYTITEDTLIFGKWVFAWNYQVYNGDYRVYAKSMPDYGFFDVSAVEINIPPILYNPQNLMMSYIKDPSNNQELFLKINGNELIDLSNNINYQLKGLQNVEAIHFNFYLWTPDREKQQDPSGWLLPYNYSNEDQRIYSYPAEYTNIDTDNIDVDLFSIKDVSNVYYDVRKITHKPGVYLIDGIINGTMTIYRNKPYKFIIDASGHPFIIKTEHSIGVNNSYNTGITNNRTDKGTIEIMITDPNLRKLYYNCEFHSTMKGFINIIDYEEDYGFPIEKAYCKTLITTNLQDFKDISSVVFSNKELLPSGKGHLPYSSNNPYINPTGMTRFNTPYLCRWSYEIKRTGLPSYYSDISNNIYNRNPYWTLKQQDNDIRIERYDKIVRYLYSNLITIKPKDPPKLIILTTNECICVDKIDNLTKTREANNAKNRLGAMLNNFRLAKRLRPRKAKDDPRAIQYIRDTGDTNVIFRYDDGSCE